MCLNRGHIFGEVAEGESAKAARVGGQQSRRHGNDLIAHDRERGDHDGQRASAERREIVYRADLLR